MLIQLVSSTELSDHVLYEEKKSCLFISFWRMLDIEEVSSCFLASPFSFEDSTRLG